MIRKLGYLVQSLIYEGDYDVSYPYGKPYVEMDATEQKHYRDALINLHRFERIVSQVSRIDTASAGFPPDYRPFGTHASIELSINTARREIS